jgi:hypothetical protein
LDAFLADNSYISIYYIEGFVPSQADTAVVIALKGAPRSDIPRDGITTSPPLPV